MAWLCPYFQCLLSLTGRDAVLDKDKAVKPDSEDVPKCANLEILRTVAPSFWFYRLGKLEDIQSSTFLSPQTGFGDCPFCYSLVNEKSY